jgi:opacity protein-like surface antigen
VKKSTLFIITLIMLCAAVPGYAQLQIGPAVGVNLGGLNVDPKAPGTTTNINSGLIAGAEIIYNFTPMFGLELQPVYIQKGGILKTAQTDMGLILEIKQTTEVNYMSVPLLLRVSFEGESVKPFLFAGMNIAVLLDDLKFTADNVTVNGQDYTDQLPPETLVQKIKSKKVDYGVTFGAGISFPVSIVDLFIKAQYNIGLENISDEPTQPDQPGITLKNRGLQVMTGLLYAF